MSSLYVLYYHYKYNIFSSILDISHLDSLQRYASILTVSVNFTKSWNRGQKMVISHMALQAQAGYVFEKICNFGSYERKITRKDSCRIEGRG